MSEYLPYLIALCALAALSALVLGLLSMVKGGEFNKKYGNRLMQWRIYCQAGAILLLGLIALS